MSNLRCYLGEFGSGKSLSLVEDGLIAADKFKKKIVVNFPLDLKWCREYCVKNNLSWASRFLRIIYIDIDKKGLDAFFIENSIILFDELGIYLDAQDWAKRKEQNPIYKRAIKTLRHHNIHLFCSFQYLDQVDKSVRESAQIFVICKGFAPKYDPSLNMPKMLVRSNFYFERSKFLQVCNDPIIMGSLIKLKWRAFKHIYVFLPWDYCKYELFTLISYLRYFFFKSAFVRYYSNHQILFNCFSSSQDFGGALRSYSKHPFMWYE